MFGSDKKPRYLSQNRGFGLIELMVSVSIVAIVMAIVLIRNSAFSSAVILRNQAYDVAFMLRSAQQQAVSSNVAAAGEVQRFGIHVEAGNNAISVFRDMNDDGFFNAGDILEKYVYLDNGFVVRDIVDSAGGNLPGSVMSITFTRPNFDAVFRRQSSGGSVGGPINIEVARVGATGNTLNDVRWVEVTSTGQVAVKPHSGA